MPEGKDESPEKPVKKQESTPEKKKGKGLDIFSLVTKNLNLDWFKEVHWRGTFRDYLDIVRDDPNVARNAYQRLYDMALSYGEREYTEHKEKILHLIQVSSLQI